MPTRIYAVEVAQFAKTERHNQAVARKDINTYQDGEENGRKKCEFGEVR